MRERKIVSTSFVNSTDTGRWSTKHLVVEASRSLCNLLGGDLIVAVFAKKGDLLSNRGTRIGDVYHNLIHTHPAKDRRPFKKTDMLLCTLYKVLTKSPCESTVLFTLPMITYFFAIFIVNVA